MIIDHNSNHFSIKQLFAPNTQKRFSNQIGLVKKQTNFTFIRLCKSRTVFNFKVQSMKSK